MEETQNSQSPSHGSDLYKKKIGFSKEYEGKVILREFEKVDCEGATVLVGFPSQTLTSIITAGFIREKFHLPIIGVITSPRFPPRCIVENGIPSHPIRIFGNKQLVIILCEFKVPETQIWGVVEAILDFADRHNCKIVIQVEGLPVEEFEPKNISQKLHFVSTNEQFTEQMKKMSHEPIVDSVIGGISGLILAEGGFHEVDVACLIVPTTVKYPDAYSALSVVKTISAYLGTEIDTTSLEQKANSLHKGVEKLLQEEQSTKHTGHMYM